MKLLENKRRKFRWTWAFRYNTVSIILKGKKCMLDCIKIKNFCSIKGTIQKNKIWATDWEEIFAKHIPDKGLTSKTIGKTLKTQH